MSICLDPTHLVTCLLINFPQLFSLVTLIICSLYNLLVFAVPCGFVTLCLMSSVSSLVQPCPALPCLLASQLVFPLRGSFCLFVLFLLNKLVAHNLHLSLRSLPFTPTLTQAAYSKKKVHFLSYFFSVWVVCVHFILLIKLFMCSISFKFMQRNIQEHGVNH